jgi:hypothetical protein
MPFRAYKNEKYIVMKNKTKYSLLIAGLTWNYAFVSTNSVIGDNEIQYTM